MAKQNSVERTAIEPFTLDGNPIAKGQVVMLTPGQIKKLADAGCVAESDTDNEDIPKRELPPVQGTAIPPKPAVAPTPTPAAKI